MVGQKCFKRGDKRAFGGQKHTKYNKINNNSENFRGLCPSGGKIAAIGQHLSLD